MLPWRCIGKDPDAQRDGGQEEKGMTEDEMVGCHYQLNGHESEQALGVGDGQGSLACCSPWGQRESNMTEQLNWTKWYITKSGKATLWKQSLRRNSFRKCLLETSKKSCLGSMRKSRGECSKWPGNFPCDLGKATQPTLALIPWTTGQPQPQCLPRQKPPC